jgi:hypothetical protein
MAAGFFWNLAGLLALAAVAAIFCRFWVHPDLLIKFRKGFQDALDDGRGPPDAHA